MIGSVAFPSRLLNDGEHVVVHTRTHAKAMLVPALLLIVIAFGTGLLYSLLPDQGSARVLVQAVFWGVAALVVVSRIGNAMVFPPLTANVLATLPPAKIGAARLSFGRPELLMELLGVEPGSVTPFALINDVERRVNVVLDAQMMRHEVLNYHPLVNSATMSVAASDLLRFIRACGHEPQRAAPSQGRSTRHVPPPLLGRPSIYELQPRRYCRARRISSCSCVSPAPSGFGISIGLSSGFLKLITQ